MTIYMQDYVCKQCNKMFRYWTFARRQFCSMGCHNEYRRRIAKCPVCGVEKILQKNKPQKDYCSLKCWGVAHRKQKDFNCLVCGKAKRCVIGKANKYCSKKCTNIGRTLSPEEYSRRSVARMRDYRIKNPERVVAWKQKRRALEFGAPGHFTHEEWIEMKELFDNKCAICGVATKMTVDHKIPLSKGGTNFIENIQPLCMPCNSRKSAKI